MVFEFAEGIRNCTSPSPRRARLFHAQRGKDYKGNDKSAASGGGSGGGGTHVLTKAAQGALATIGLRLV